MSKIVVYTAITNNKDTLREDQCIEGAEFIAFLDQETKSKVWQVSKAHNEFSDPRRNARIHKMLPHKYFPEHDYSLWLDGAISLQVPVQSLIGQYLQDVDIAFFKHPSRNSLYQEAEECKRMKLDDLNIIENQMERYHKEGFPENFGLAESGVLLRRNTKAIQEFNEVWWNEVKNGSRRDQLSMFYAIWKTGLTYKFFPGQIQNDPNDSTKNGNPYVKWYLHNYFKDEDSVSLQ